MIEYVWYSCNILCEFLVAVVGVEITLWYGLQFVHLQNALSTLSNLCLGGLLGSSRIVLQPKCSQLLSLCFLVGLVYLGHLLNGNSQCNNFQLEFYLCNCYVCMSLDISKETARGWQKWWGNCK